MALPVVTGDPFMPSAAENALQHIRNQYWARGYNDVRATYRLTIDRVGGRAAVAFTVDEGRQSIVKDIRIAGNDKTSERLVREQIIVSPDEPLNLQALSRSRKNLYDSGAFSIVDLSRDTVVDTTPTRSEDAGVIGAVTGEQVTRAGHRRRHSARGAAVSNSLRCVVRHGRQTRRRARCIAAQRDRQGARLRLRIALRRADSRGSCLHVTADAAALADPDHGVDLFPR